MRGAKQRALESRAHNPGSRFECTAYRRIPLQCSLGGTMTDISRRRFLEYSMGTGAAVVFAPSVGLSRSAATSSASAVGPTLEKFVQPLPLPGAGLVVATPTGSSHYSFVQRQIEPTLHP